MEEKFNKLKETLKPEMFTDEDFPVKSTENNPWLEEWFHLSLESFHVVIIWILKFENQIREVKNMIRMAI